MLDDFTLTKGDKCADMLVCECADEMTKHNRI